MGIEHKLLVLKLNKNWKVVDQGIVGDALVDLAGGKNSYALDISYGMKEDGTMDFSNAQTVRPVGWDEWITLPVREWDFSIKTINREIRVPTVLVARNYEGIPKLKVGRNPSNDQIRIRDGDVCQYTGRRLKKDEISIDHVIPKSRGGDNSWRNRVTTSRDINARKGNKLNQEIGLRLIRPPVIPEPIPRYKLIRESKHPDWNLFLTEIK